MSISYILNRTKEILNANFGTIFLVSLIYTVLCGLLGMIPIAGTIATIFLGVNLSIFMYQVAVNRSGSIGQLFDFTYSWKVIKVTLWTFVKMIVPYIVLMIGVFIAVLSLNTTDMIDGMIVANVINGGVAIMLFVLIIGCGVWMYYLSLKYGLGIYIAIDRPDLTAKQSVELSGQYMQGYKGNLFLYSLVVGLLVLVACIPCGLGLIYMIPFTMLSAPVWYVCLKEQMIPPTQQYNNNQQYNDNQQY